MYIPHFNAVTDEPQIRDFVHSARVAQLVTVARDGRPQATLLPIIWEGDTVIAHVAKANPQWREITDGAPGLAIVSGPDAYITPSWYAAKSEHGKVVPTWNYSAVHLSGALTVHHDPEWLLDMVTRLTARHETGREEPWAVSDAPDRYIAGSLRAIVGIGLTVERVEAKAKMSQNRSEADQRGTIAGLRAEKRTDAALVADAMTHRALIGPGEPEPGR